jgi:hypothetical protein
MQPAAGNQAGLDSGVVGVPGTGHDSGIKQRGEAGRRQKGVGDGNIGACLRRNLCNGVHGAIEATG